MAVAVYSEREEGQGGRCEWGTRYSHEMMVTDWCDNDFMIDEIMRKEKLGYKGDWGLDRGIGYWGIEHMGRVICYG